MNNSTGHQDTFVADLAAYKANMCNTTNNCIANLRPETRETEKVLKGRIKADEEEYLIKWKNEDSSRNTWIKKSKLDDEAQKYLVTHSVKFTGGRSSSTNQDRGPCNRMPEPNSILSVISNISRVTSMCTYLGKFAYKVQLDDGTFRTVKEEQIPRHIYERYMLVGF